MDDETRQQIEAAIETMPDGQERVNVSLQYQHQFTEGTRDERRHHLAQIFQALLVDLPAFGVEVLPDSLAVSAQSIDASVPLDNYEDMVAAMALKEIRVDPIIPRQIAPD